MDIEPVCELPKLTRRAHSGHKGTYGTVQIVAGSQSMPGAAVLSGRAALRAGAGLVRVACPACVQNVVAVGHSCYTTNGLRQHTDGSFSEGVDEEVIELGRRADVVALGPGLGQNTSVRAFVRSVVAGVSDIPLVLDADGLNAIAPIDDSFPKRVAPTILTPHPGEFARLIGKSVAEILAKPETIAHAFALQVGVVLLLKGANTLVTDGRKAYRNTTGNPGMATGGSGDVLTGIIAALVAQRMMAFDAAVLGAWVHGKAGDLAAMRFGQTALIASDIIEFLPAAFRELENQW